MNTDLTDQNAIKAFIETAKDVSSQLSSRYESQWINPNQDKRNGETISEEAREASTADMQTNPMQNALQKKVDKQSVA